MHEAFFIDPDAVTLQPVLLQLLGQEVAPRDLVFFVGDIPGEPDDLHAVRQHLGDGVDGIGGGDEEHVRQVEGRVDIVVAEFHVLLRVEHLQERRGGVALEALAQLVDLVEHEDRVPVFAYFQALDDLARHGADVGAPVSLDLGLVAHAAQGHAEKCPVEGAGDRFTERCFAHTRRAHQADDRALAVRLQLLDREELQYPSFSRHRGRNGRG